MTRLWNYAAWAAALVLSVTLAFLAIVYGKKTPAVTRAKLREREAKLRQVKLERDLAKAEADLAANEADAERYMDKAETLELRVIDLQAHRDQLTGDYSKAAEALRDEDFADFDNSQRAASRGTSQG